MQGGSDVWNATRLGCAVTALLMACSGEGLPNPADEAAWGAADAEPVLDLALDQLLAANQARIDELVLSMAAEGEVVRDDELAGASGRRRAMAEFQREDELRARRSGRMTEEEKSDALALVAAAGISPARVSFSGRLVIIDGDTELDLDTLAAPIVGEALDEGSTGKGKVLGQIVSVGTPPLAPAVYAQSSGGTWLFNRPDLEQNVILIPDAAPNFVFNDFVTAVAAVADASSADCLGGGFMTVMRKSTYDSMPAAGRATLRTKTVVYESGACPGGYSACAQFPLLQNVVISPPGPDGTGGVSRERFVTGRRLGVDSTQVTSSSSASRATFVHELLHTLGLSHPKAEALGSGQNVTKLVVPGTLAGSCASAPCAPGTNYPSIMHQAVDLGRTNSLQPDDLDVIATLYTSTGGCSYRNAARPVVAQ